VTLLRLQQFHSSGDGSRESRAPFWPARRLLFPLIRPPIAGSVFAFVQRNVELSACNMGEGLRSVHSLARSAISARLFR
jgi:hypothetical protein